MVTNRIQNSTFVVGPEREKAQPWCVWEWDLCERNLRFLELTDPDYFNYVVDLNVEQLQGDDAKRAAVAIRIAYHHSLETLFTLLGATLQAPNCVVGWVPKCATGTLRDLVCAISAERRVPNALRLERVSWHSLAQAVCAYSHQSAEEREKNAVRFGGLWRRLSHDFQNDEGINEYNSLKHGFRVQSGGFSLAFGLEQSPGVLAPGETMQSMGGSRFGSSFYVPEPIEGAPAPGTSGKKRDDHFRVREHSLNWDPICDAHAVKLAAMSIGNVISFLRIANGAKPETVQFRRPADAAGFAAPWSSSVGVRSMSMDDNVRESDIQRADRQEPLEVLGLTKPKEPPSGSATGKTQCQ